MRHGDYVTSWLALEDDDTVYPWKNAIIIKYGQGGYYQTDWKLRKEDIIARNKTCGITEEDRVKAEGQAIHMSASEPEWKQRKDDFTLRVVRRLERKTKKELCNIIAELLFVDGDDDAQLEKLKEVE